jgi:signal transduction histidine kinase
MRYSRALFVYVAVVLAGGLALLAFALWRYPLNADPIHWVLFGVLALLVALTDRYGLQLTQGTHVHVDGIPLLASVLLFTPAYAMLIAALGRVFGRIDRRQEISERAFNLGQTLVYVGAAALIRSTFTATPWVPGGWLSGLGLALTMLVMYLLNTGLVAGIVSFQQRNSFLAVWAEAAPLDLMEQSVSLGLGLLTALVVVPYPWALLLMTLPSTAIFVTLNRTLKMEAQQKQLAETNAELATHLSRQAEQLRDAYAVLENAHDTKNQMLQNVSHELRTPMVSVSGYTEALQEGLYGPLSEKQRGALDIISRNTQRMIHLVNDLLSLQALDRGQLQMDEIDLTEVLRNCLVTFDERAREVGIDLQAECATNVPHLHADAARLEQALSNLVDNALKFSPNGGEVLLRAELIDTETVQIAVSDQGIGIPKADLSNIYQRFYQVDGSYTRKYGGQGLGLAITKRIIELHGGGVRAESEVNRGTCFYITLPVVKGVPVERVELVDQLY